MTHHKGIIASVALSLCAVPACMRAQSVTTDARRDSSAIKRDDAELEQRAQRARRSGGLRVGAWSAARSATSGSASASETPAFEGFVRKGLDVHLALENSIGFWRQRHTSTGVGGVLGGATSTSVDDYIVPQYTSLLFYPFTRPEHRLEPYVRGGLGFTLGVEDQGSNGGGGGVSFVPGFGGTAGAGLEWRPVTSLGLALSGRYQWVRFFQDFGSQRIYEGPAVDLGVTYRFQFR